MAAIEFDDYDYGGDRPEGGVFAAALNWAGAFLSILLIAGLATWGWKLWVRDVSGVPVVRALEGPMRIAPEDPGGLASEYQGLSVNRIAEERIEESMAERVVLAPQPNILDDAEDLPMAELAPAPVIETAPTIDQGPTVLPSEVVDADLVETGPAFLTDESERAEIAVLPAEPERSATDLAVAAALAELGLEETSQAIDANPGVPAVTPRPLIRPENLQSVSYMPVSNGLSGEIDPVTIPVGTRLVQLGAFASAEIAREAWQTASARFGDYMVGKERVVQEAQTGGRTFFRLRAMGFEDLSDARRFCAVLVSDGANCIPVVHK